MEKIKKINDVYKIVLGTVATILTTFALDSVSQKIGDKGYATLMTVLIVSIVIIILNQLAESIFEKSTFIRKILFGDEFIEGWWYDISYNEQAGTVQHGVLISISYEEWKYKVNGATYDTTGKRIATFKSTESNYSKRVLFFQYESHTRYQENFIELGINQLCFDSPPTSYTGFYLDFGNSMRFKIYGDKVAENLVKENNNFKTNNDKKNFILNKIEEFKQNHTKVTTNNG